MSQQQTVSEKIKGQNNQNQKVQQQATQTKDKVELVFEKPQEFLPQYEKRVVTVMDLCKLTNSLFKALPDWDGSIIKPDPNGNLQCFLYFHLSPKQDEHSIVIPADKTFSSNDVMTKYQRMSAKSQNRKLVLTDFGKQILFDYIYKGNAKDWNQVNWNMYVSEQVDIQQYGQPIPLLCVGNIDLLKIIPKFYDNPSKKHYQWNIRIGNPLNVANFSGVPNLEVAIERVDCKEVGDLAIKTGYITAAGSLPIVRS